MDISKVVSIPANIIINSGLSPHFIAKFVFFVSCLLFGTILIERVLRYLFRMPPIAGQIVGGIIMGPSLLNVSGWHVFQQKIEFIDYATNVAYSFVSADLFVLFILLISGGFTVAYLLWLAGHETDIKDIAHVGVTATGAGVMGALIPIGVIASWMIYVWGGISVAAAVGIGLIFAATSVSIPVAALFSRNKMHLHSSKATLGAAIIDDIFAVILLSLFMIGLQSGMFGKAIKVGGHASSILNSIGLMLVTFIAFGIVGYFVLVPFVRWVKLKDRSHLLAATATIFMLSFFAFSELIGGLAGITGAYFAGMFHRMADKKHNAVKVISPYINAIFLPLFLGSIGLQLDLKVLSAGGWYKVAVLTVLAILTKFVGTFLATGLSNFFGSRSRYRWGFIDSFLFSSAMVARGEVGLVIATLLKGTGIMTFSDYVISVVVIILTTLIAPILLNIGFALQDKYASEGEDGYILNLGHFKVIGTMQMFNVVVGLIEKHKGVNTTIQLSEGRKFVVLEDLDVKIVYIPNDGIVIEGNKKNIDEIMKFIGNEINSEISHIGASSH